MPLYLFLVAKTRLLELVIPLEYKNDTTHTSIFGGAGLGSWSRFGEDVKISGKEAAMFPDFKRIVYNRISKTVHDGQNFSYKPDLECQFPKFRKKYPFFVFYL